MTISLLKRELVTIVKFNLSPWQAVGEPLTAIDIWAVTFDNSPT